MKRAYSNNRFREVRAKVNIALMKYYSGWDGRSSHLAHNQENHVRFVDPEQQHATRTNRKRSTITP